ncbi:MAG TPA: hypothetical protein VHU89_12060 [Acidobacteriaceae bacterium]|jgi:hypothetical protein|nr:hypothetical protein [Acidobacteriaceae bacterium]
MPDLPRRKRNDRSFLFLLMPLAVASVPSLLFCALEIALALHGNRSGGSVLVFHLPPRSAWDRLLALQTSVYGWVARWNAFCTLAATGLLVATLLLPRWRHWLLLVLIPFGVLLCADFTLHWRAALLP